jgi:hypothetical protein
LTGVGVKAASDVIIIIIIIIIIVIIISLLKLQKQDGGLFRGAYLQHTTDALGHAWWQSQSGRTCKPPGPMGHFAWRWQDDLTEKKPRWFLHWPLPASAGYTKSAQCA